MLLDTIDNDVVVQQSFAVLSVILKSTLAAISCVVYLCADATDKILNNSRVSKNIRNVSRLLGIQFIVKDLTTKFPTPLCAPELSIEYTTQSFPGKIN